MGRNILKSSLQNASFSIVFQVIFRCITFAINAFILRHVGRDVLGVMNVRLLLLESTLLFLSREPFLRACLSPAKGRIWPQLINQMWLTVPLVTTLSGLFVYVWLRLLPPVENQFVVQYEIACYAIAFSCLVEMAAQSAALVGQVFCFVKLRVVIDTIHITIRTIIFIIIVLFNKHLALVAFSVAQVCSAFVVFLGYYLYFYWYMHRLKKYRFAVKLGKENIDKQFGSNYEHMEDFPFSSITEFFPGVMKNMDKTFNKDLLVLTQSFAKQGIVKQVLTEGEKYVMSLSPVLSFGDQATYDIVNNLGSLAARFIFRPIEDSGYFYFTQMVKRDEPLMSQDESKIVESSQVLAQLCKVATTIGLLVLVFGQSYAETLLLLYGGPEFVADGLPVVLLRCHCLAIVLLAVNGVTECFTFATMNSMQLDRYNYLMVIFSGIFLILSYGFTSMFGPIGFIFANCLNMIARILHSIYFINEIFRTTGLHPMREIWPGTSFITVLCGMGVLVKLSENIISPRSLILHISFGAACFAITLAVWSYDNKVLLKAGYDKFFSSAKEKSQ